MEHEQLTIVGPDGDRYHTDRDTVDLLRTAQTYDHRTDGGGRQMQDMVFEHAHQAGRISEGPAYSHVQQADHEQETTHTHGYRR